MPKFNITISREDDEREQIPILTALIERAIQDLLPNVEIDLDETSNADVLTFEVETL